MTSAKEEIDKMIREMQADIVRWKSTSAIRTSVPITAALAQGILGNIEEFTWKLQTLLQEERSER